METPRVLFDEIEDEVATFVLYKDEGSRELFRYPIDDLPKGVDRDQFGCTFRPELDDNGDIVALHYDKELTEQSREEAEEAYEQYKEMLGDSE
jgi:hypothetical protein